MKFVWAAAALSLTCASLSALSSDHYQFTTLAVPGALTTVPTAINSSAEVAGYYTNSDVLCCSDYEVSWRGFVFRNGTYTTFDMPGARWTKPLSISNDGQIFGSFFAGSGPQQAFAYDIRTGQFRTLPFRPPEGPFSPPAISINGISSSGSTVVGIDAYNGGFIYKNGKVTLLHPPASLGATAIASPIAVSVAGEVVGTYGVSSSTNQHWAAAPFRYLDGLYTPLDERFTPTAIGPSGQILGTFFASDGLIHSAIYQNGAILLFDVPEAPNHAYIAGTFLSGINSAGQIIGVADRPFIATPIAASGDDTTRVYIDFSDKEAIGGAYRLVGWAINNSSGIAAVSVRVDGYFMGNATYGSSRPDVCRAYPGQVGCPNVGWTFPLETTILADGTHTLEVVAVSAGGTRAASSTRLMVSNGTIPATSSVLMNIDVPSHNGRISGKATLSGWAFDSNSPLREVDVEFDRRPSSINSLPLTAGYGFARPDVCAATSNAKNCLTSGWTMQWDTTPLANGEHELRISAQAFNGDRRSITTKVIVNNDGPLRAYIDQPNAELGPVSGSVLVYGWALDDSSRIADAQLLIDDSPYYFSSLYRYGFRPDVCLVYPSSPDCPNVGWSTSLNTTLLANGRHSMAFQATAFRSDGPHAVTTSPVTLVLNNSNLSNTTRVYVDQPTSQAQTYWGTSTFSGWAIDDSTPIQNVQAFIDGRTVGLAYSSAPRGDVCVVYPNRPGCPNVGWSYVFDTTALTNGVHTFTATAISSTGLQASVSRTFTISNSNGTDSTIARIDMPNAQTSPIAGQANFYGWAINQRDPITNLLVSVDGQPIGLATSNMARPDVCSLFPNAPGCPEVGWLMPVDTTTLLNGVHQLSVTATTHVNNLVPYDAHSSESATASTFFTVANSPDQSPIQLYIDSPRSLTSTVSGVVSFAGWAIDRSTAISSVSVSIDGQVPNAASYGVHRPDVCAAYTNYSGCPAANVGWVFVADTTALANGAHTLNLTATSSDGVHKTISAPFTVIN